MRADVIDASTLDLLRRSVAAGGPIPTYHRLELALRDAMTSGALPPGSRLPPHSQLANLLGVGRNTLRAALRRLEQDHLIESNNGGTYVKRDLDQLS